MSATEIISLVSAIFTGVSVACVIYGARNVHLARLQFKQDHERSRREQAIRLFTVWNQCMSAETIAVRNLAESLEFNEIKQIIDSEPYVSITYSGKIGRYLRGIFGDDWLKKKGLEEEESKAKDMKPVDLEYSEVIKIRWLLVRLLNHLETICSAWHYKVAHEEMILEQFLYLVAPEKGHELLKKARDAGGGKHTWPNIERFHNKIVESSKATEAKKALGEDD